MPTLRTFPAGEEVLAPTHPGDPAWLELRKNSIGASEAGPLMGESYVGVDAYSVWAGKLAEEPEQFDDRTLRIFARGHALEPLAVALWEEAHPGHQVAECGVVRSNTNPYATCTPDRLIDANAGLEIKTVGTFAWKRLTPDEVPRKYYWQLVQSLFVTGLDEWHLLALQPDSWETMEWSLRADDPQVQADMKLIDAVILDFWESHIMTGTPPEDHEMAVAEELPEGTYELEESDAGSMAAIAERYLEINEEIKVLNDEKSALANTLKEVAGEHETVAAGGHVLYRYGTSTRTSVDAKKLQQGHPDVYALVASTKTTRSLTVPKPRN